MAPKQAPKPEFQEGERVLCFHGPLLYEAKCLKVAREDKQVRYLIHYSGWNKNWDEWVPESRVLKYSEANLQRQRELQRANQEQQAAEGRGARGAAPGRRGASALQQKNVETLFQNIRITPAASSPGATAAASGSAPALASTSAPAEVPGPGRKTRKGKQKAAATAGGEGGPGTSSSGAAVGGRDTPQPLPRRRGRGDPGRSDGPRGAAAASSARAELQVQIPAELKPLLVQDWELVTKQGRLVALPAAKNVDSILEDYVRHRKAHGGTGDHLEYAADEVAGGIRAYFNVMLGPQLLYERERPQHNRVLAAHPDVPMSGLYGAPHLLRLFVRIGTALSYTPFDDKSLALLFGYLHDFLRYLASDPSAFFDVSDYKEAPEASQKAARTTETSQKAA
ncbi:mortality factor 4-like protein 1 [Monodelphis domestica]|uniref:mortality factor 4-like protein 1 n=1 Tax=Monodelphis domestica TaxID=13616 RepID=UPI0024E1B16C|nr:mortality factor 4-like protein 1 [Monodelphis domestica]